MTDNFDNTQGGLFDAPTARTRDRAEAHSAAVAMEPKRGKIQREVIGVYRAHGDMTSKVAEALPCFAHYGRSTVQKRISELAMAGVLELVPDADEAVYRLNEYRIRNPRTKEDVARCPTCGRASSVPVPSEWESFLHG